MPSLDTRDDRKVREAEVFYYSQHMESGTLEQLSNLAHQSLQMDCPEAEMAKWLKCTLEKLLPGKWSVILGKTFGAFLSMDARNFVHFRIGRTYFVLYYSHAKAQP